jgi:hypothetical protein
LLANCWSYILDLLDINERGEEIAEDRPSGPNAECRQAAKTINASFQKRLRAEKRRRELAVKYNEAKVIHSVIDNILQRNKVMEVELASKTETNLLADTTVGHFLPYTAAKLEDFIHARKFKGKQFQKTKLTPPGKKLNKTVYRGQTADDIAQDCSDENPCLVWLVWRLRTHTIVLEMPALPVLNTSLQMPEFTIAYAGRMSGKCPSEYLLSNAWVATLKSTVKGVSFRAFETSMIDEAKLLVLAMLQRLDLHIADPDRVDIRRHHHYTLDFVRDNVPAMAAILCLSGQVVDHLASFRIDECLLVHPKESGSDDVFHPISNAPADSRLGKLEGSYKHYDSLKKKWIRSGKASGKGGFDGRMKQHTKNARMVDQMRKHRFYQEYPAKGVENIGGIGGYHDNLLVYCGMAFDRAEDVSPLCSDGTENSLFVWTNTCTDILKQREGTLEDSQLLAIAYLWEICDDLLMAKCDNVSSAPGFEALGLRIN